MKEKLYVTSVKTNAMFSQVGAPDSYVTCEAKSPGREVTLEWGMAVTDAPRVGDVVRVKIEIGEE